MQEGKGKGEGGRPSLYGDGFGRKHAPAKAAVSPFFIIPANCSDGASQKERGEGNKYFFFFAFTTEIPIHSPTNRKGRKDGNFLYFTESPGRASTSFPLQERHLYDLQRPIARHREGGGEQSLDEPTITIPTIKEKYVCEGLSIIVLPHQIVIKEGGGRGKRAELSSIIFRERKKTKRR